ncbi:B3 domain-containing protein At2g32645-like [Gossypium hirsutum]|uniref:B3 domain-containing protein At2g32645-like n=1 Tax=Gossypium hirsutum TaxID=3635 RepID=A0A1U8KMU3_GOSHI|nr:B3 domain-containing protein At2g32645-like [Gossypium hirsutum]
MGGTGLVLVIQKTIFYSDVNPTASRFSIPFSQVKTHDFLNKAETKELAHKNPMQVCLLDPSLQQTSITFNKWVMGNTSLYVLTNTWNCVVKNNQLEKGVMVQLWSFRMNSLLYIELSL